MVNTEGNGDGEETEQQRKYRQQTKGKKNFKVVKIDRGDRVEEPLMKGWKDKEIWNVHTGDVFAKKTKRCWKEKREILGGAKTRNGADGVAYYRQFTHRGAFIFGKESPAMHQVIKKSLNKIWNPNVGQRKP